MENKEEEERQKEIEIKSHKHVKGEIHAEK